MQGSQESLAQDTRGTIAPWLPEQTDYTDARDLMSGYQGGERIAQRDTGTFQDLTPKADPSRAMEMLSMFKKEGKALTDQQFEVAMGSLGMSDVLADHRSQMNNFDESLNTLMNDNTNDFGEQVSTDYFGQSDYDLKQQRQDELDRLMMQDSVGERAENSMAQMHAVNGTTPNVIPEEPKPIVEQSTNSNLSPFGSELISDSARYRQNVTDAWDAAKGFGSDAWDVAKKADKIFTKGALDAYDKGLPASVTDAYDMLSKGTSDVVMSIPSAYSKGVGGITKAIKTATNVALGEEYFDENDGGILQASTPDYNYPTFGNISETVLSYAGGATGAVKLLSKTPTLVKYLGAVMGGTATLDPTEGNLSTMIQDTDYRNALSEYLASSPDQEASSLEKLEFYGKTFLEDTMLGAIAEGAIATYQGIKSNPDLRQKIMQELGDVADKAETMAGNIPGVETEKTIAKEMDNRPFKEPEDNSGMQNLLDATTSKETRIALNEQKAEAKTQAQAIKQAQYDAKPKAEIDEAGFYSRAEQAVLDLKQEKHSPEDIKRYLQKQGVTNNEMEDMGLFKMLDEKHSKGESVTKQSLLDYVIENKPMQSEVVLKGGGKKMWSDLENEDGWQVENDSWKDSSIDNKTQDAYEQFNMDASGFDDYEELGIALSKHDPVKYPSGKEADWQGKMFDTLDEFGYDGLDMETSYDLDTALIDMYEEQYKATPVMFKKVNVADGQDIVVYQTQEGFVARPDGRFNNPENDIFDSPVDSIGEAVVKLQEKFGDQSVGKTKHYGHTQPGVDFSTYEEVYIPSDMVKKMGGYSNRPHHGDIEDVALHLRTSVRTDNDGNKVLFIEELQSDLHQSGRQKDVGYADKSSEAYRKTIGPKQDELRDKQQARKDLEKIEEEKIEKHFDETGSLLVETKIHPNRGEVTARFDDSQVKHAFDRNEKEIAENYEYINKYEGYIRDKNPNFDLNSVELHLNQHKDRVVNLERNRKGFMYNIARENVNNANPELVMRVEELQSELSKIKHKISKTEPNAPLKDDAWIQAGLEKAIQMAKKKGIDRVAWTDSSQQVASWNDEYIDLYKELYDNKLPGAAKRLSNQYNAETGKVEMDFINTGTDESRIPDSVKDVNYIKITSGLAVGTSGGIALADDNEEIKPPLYTEPEKPLTSVLSGIKKPKVVRNVRSNNPGNIKDFGIKWDGMTGIESGGSVAEGSFVVFDKPENGIRALTKDLTNKRKRGLDTITKILNTYAPNGKENDTKSYIKDVANDVGISATDKLSDRNMFKMIKAITKHEGGKESLEHFNDTTIKKGMKSAYKNRYQDLDNKSPNKKQLKRWMKQDNWTGSEADYVQHIVKQ